MHALFFDPPVQTSFIGHQVAEIFKEQVYDQYLIGKKDLTILDIGANVGVTAYYFSQFAKTVYSLEPSSKHFAVLQKTIEFNELKNVIPLKMALSNKDGESSLFHNPGNQTMDSLVPLQAAPGDQPEVVRLVRLDTLFKENNIDHVDFMKLDVEGLEGEILCGDAFQLVAPKIDFLTVELHSWGIRKDSQIMDALKLAGYRVNKLATDASIWTARR